MYEHRSFKKGKVQNVKCRIQKVGLDKYVAEGLCHETVHIRADEDSTDSDDLELNEGLWYDIEGKIVDYQDGLIDLNVDSDENIDEIGVEINDWLDLDRSFVTDRTYSGTASSGSSSVKKRLQSLSMSGGQTSAKMEANAPATGGNADPAAQSDISGFATGGSKDIENFRKNIHNGYVPRKESIEYEGLFYDYEFDVSGTEKESLFYPVYEHGYCSNPFTEDRNHYLTVGLESGIESFTRPEMDLMLVLDVSGSMDRSMDEYYYDDPNRDTGSQQSKIESTKKVVSKIIEQLNPDDRLGVVLYNTDSWVSKPLRKVEHVDTEALIEDGLKQVNADGGTNLSSGFEKAVREYSLAGVDTENLDRESRVMFLTDAMPNMGRTDETELVQQIRDASEESIHTTFIGIGVDANQELISALSGIRGSNHYFVKSTDEFKQRIAEEFVYITVPLVFDLKLQLEGDNYSIKDVYGNPSQDNGGDSILTTNTLFPSTGEDGTKGGVILVELDDVDSESELRISATWTETDGTEGSDVRTIDISDPNEDYFESDSVRKAIALQKYAEELRSWSDSYEFESGGRTKWEQKSNNQAISSEQLERFRKLRKFMSYHFSNIEDSCEEEIHMLDEMIDDDKSQS